MKSYCSSYEIKMAMDYANALSQFVNFAPKNVITYPFPLASEHAMLMICEWITETGVVSARQKNTEILSEGKKDLTHHTL